MSSVEQILTAGHPELYRICVLSAAILGGFLIKHDSQSWPLLPQQKIGIFLSTIVGAMLGSALPAFFARGAVGQMMLQISSENNSTWENFIYEFYLGPKTIVGGLLLSFFAVAIYKRLARIRYDTSDSFARGVCLMMAIGRLGCVAQHCCYGVVVNSQWGIELGDGRSRFPVQSLEAIFLFVTFFVLNFLHQRNYFQSRRLFFLFVVYGIARFLFEFLREPVAELRFGLGYYQWIALFLVMTGFFQIFKRSLEITSSDTSSRAERFSVFGRN